MAASQACTGLRQASTFGVRQPAALHDTPTCASPVLFARRSLHVRHLGAKPSLGSCRGLSSKRNDVRPAVPRQGRLQCHAARSQVTQVTDWNDPMPASEYCSLQQLNNFDMCAQTQNPFRQPKEMDGVQKALAGLPGAVFYGAALLLVTAAGACGFVAGSRAPGASFEH